MHSFTKIGRALNDTDPKMCIHSRPEKMTACKSFEWNESNNNKDPKFSRQQNNNRIAIITLPP